MNLFVPAQGRQEAYLKMTDNLVYRFEKRVANDGEKIAYRLSESQLSQCIDFNTYYFDDYVELAVFQRGSTAQSNFVGREKLRLRNLVFGQLNALTLSEDGHEIGTVFLTAEYWPMDAALLKSSWKVNLLEPHSPYFDKYEFMNDNLQNVFIDKCQFGYLQMELDSFNIPMMSKNYKS